MKGHTSKLLKSIALYYMGFPITYLLTAALLFDIPAVDCAKIILLPTFYIVSLVSVAAGYGLWEMRRWGWYVFLLANVLMVYQSIFFVVHYSESHHKFVALAVALLAVYGIVLRLKREIRVPYFLPRISWWESNPRYRIAVPVNVSQASGDSFDGEILDISMGGCFLKSRGEVSQEEALSLRFSVFGQELICDGVVVWRTQSTVTHPKGMGVKFSALASEQKRSLKVITGRLKKISDLYRRSRFLMSNEEFTKALADLQSPITTRKTGR